MYLWGGKEIISEEALAKNLKQFQDERGMSDRLRTHIRNLILNELLSGPAAKAPVPVTIRSRAIGSLLLEWLLQHDCHYTVCMLTSEMPSLTDLPELALKDGSKRKPEDVKEILEVLKIFDENTGKAYYNSNDTLISCIFKAAADWKDLLKFRNEDCRGDFEDCPPQWAAQLRAVLTSVGVEPHLLPQLQSSLSRMFTKLIQDSLNQEKEAFESDLIDRERKFQSYIKNQEDKINSKLIDIEGALDDIKGSADDSLSMKKDAVIRLLADVREQHKSVVDGLSILEKEELDLERNRIEWQNSVLKENQRLEELAKNLEKKALELALEKEKLKLAMDKPGAFFCTKRGPPVDTALSPKTFGSLKAARKGELQSTDLQSPRKFQHTQSLDAIATCPPVPFRLSPRATQRILSPRGSDGSELMEKLLSSCSPPPKQRESRAGEIPPIISNTLSPKEVLPSCEPRLQPFKSPRDYSPAPVQSTHSPKEQTPVLRSPRELTSLPLGNPLSPRDQDSLCSLQLPQKPEKKGPLYPTHPTHSRSPKSQSQPHVATQQNFSQPQTSGSAFVPSAVPNRLCSRPLQQSSGIPVMPASYNLQNSSRSESLCDRSRSPVSTSTLTLQEVVERKALSKRLKKLREEGRRAKRNFESYRDNFDDENSDSCDERSPRNVFSYLQNLRARPYPAQHASQVSFPNLHEGTHPGPCFHLPNDRPPKNSQEFLGQGDMSAMLERQQSLQPRREVPRMSFLDKIADRRNDNEVGIDNSNSIKRIKGILESVRTADAAICQKRDSSGDRAAGSYNATAYKASESTKVKQSLLQSFQAILAESSKERPRSNSSLMPAPKRVAKETDKFSDNIVEEAVRRVPASKVKFISPRTDDECDVNVKESYSKKSILSISSESSIGEFRKVPIPAVNNVKFASPRLLTRTEEDGVRSKKSILYVSSECSIGEMPRPKEVGCFEEETNINAKASDSKRRLSLKSQRRVTSTAEAEPTLNVKDSASQKSILSMSSESSIGNLQSPREVGCIEEGTHIKVKASDSKNSLSIKSSRGVTSTLEAEPALSVKDCSSETSILSTSSKASDGTLSTPREDTCSDINVKGSGSRSSISSDINIAKIEEVPSTVDNERVIDVKGGDSRISAISMLSETGIPDATNEVKGSGSNQAMTFELDKEVESILELKAIETADSVEDCKVLEATVEQLTTPREVGCATEVKDKLSETNLKGSGSRTSISSERRSDKLASPVEETVATEDINITAGESRASVFSIPSGASIGWKGSMSNRSNCSLKSGDSRIPILSSDLGNVKLSTSRKWANTATLGDKRSNSNMIRSDSILSEASAVQSSKNPKKGAVVVALKDKSSPKGDSKKIYVSSEARADRLASPRKEITTQVKDKWSYSLKRENSNSSTISKTSAKNTSASEARVDRLSSPRKEIRTEVKEKRSYGLKRDNSNSPIIFKTGAKNPPRKLRNKEDNPKPEELREDSVRLQESEDDVRFASAASRKSPGQVSIPSLLQLDSSDFSEGQVVSTRQSSSEDFWK